MQHACSPSYNFTNLQIDNYHDNNFIIVITIMTRTVGRINFEDKKFRGYLLNLEIKYPRKFPA